jgi:hypothetical protein
MYCDEEPAFTPPDAVGGFNRLVVNVVVSATGPKRKDLFDAMMSYPALIGQ